MRQNIAYVSLLAALLALLVACSSSPKVSSRLSSAPPAVDWSFARNAIDLHIKADPHLNLFNQVPHTLLLCIYLLRDPYTINQLQQEPSGLQTLLDCGRIDPSILHARRLVLQPGQELHQSMDRPEGARFIGIAAGYFNGEKDRTIRSFALPVAEENRNGNPLTIPQKMSLSLQLGPQAMLALPVPGEAR